MPRRVALPCLMLLLAVASSTRARAEPSSPAIAVRAGWAYGLGLELEYRPRSWGVGASAGYVPGYGPGGYLGVQWGLHPLARSGPVAEAGVFRGVENPFRVARAGLGPYALAGYAFAHAGWLSVRFVAGGGAPLGDPEHAVSFEFLAKLTAGILF